MWTKLLPKASNEPSNNKHKKHEQWHLSTIKIKEPSKFTISISNIIFSTPTLSPPNLIQRKKLQKETNPKITDFVLYWRSPSHVSSITLRIRIMPATLMTMTGNLRYRWRLISSVSVNFLLPLTSFFHSKIEWQHIFECCVS